MRMKEGGEKTKKTETRKMTRQKSMGYFPLPQAAKAKDSGQGPDPDPVFPSFDWKRGIRPGTSKRTVCYRTTHGSTTVAPRYCILRLPW